ncbi:hypothetical protein D9M71_245120 [compost metagenome]
MRHPTSSPNQVPAGTPNDNATGAPIIATAMARPCCSGLTMRRACPAITPQARPAATPVMKRATSVSQYELDSAVTVLNSRKPTIASNSTGRRRQPWVRVTSGMAVNSEPRAYTLTICPAMASLTCMPLEICPGGPAGRVSLRMAIKPVMARASRPLTGKGCSSAAGPSAVQLIGVMVKLL